MSQASLPDTAYWRGYQARASGLLQWKDVDALWANLSQTPKNWFVYDLETSPPNAVLPAPDFSAFLKTAEALVNARRDRSHSGAVYIDNPAAPAFIKIFDPVNMGTSCSGDHEMIFPRYIVSKIQPDARPAAKPKKKGFLGRLILKPKQAAP